MSRGDRNRGEGGGGGGGAQCLGGTEIEVRGGWGVDRGTGGQKQCCFVYSGVHL